ncbi:phage tail assembly protein [Escherichia coli]|nr:phage tail assembly protein [Escherichia coli]
MTVTLRELTAGDLIDAQAAAEKLVMSKEGPILVSSPSRMGLEMLRRQIASVGCIKGPLSMALIRKLSADDFSVCRWPQKCTTWLWQHR